MIIIRFKVLGALTGHVVLCDLNSGNVPELCNSGTYQNCLSQVAILERTRIQFWYVYTFRPKLLLQLWDVPELPVNYLPIAC